MPNNITVDVDPSKFPYGETGQPGSVLDIALTHGVDLEHVCGGNIACSTCHVIVEKGFNTCSAMTSDEQDQLENASGKTAQSRLSCQCIPDGSEDVVVRIP
ncbi:MAG: 2Fe-2S iron-sulfur cluster binding domain-containing protein [Oligoflexia bacterium]|nr:2Fe-2S iron-sulfur cluster binding domain-containing protein [Oligoflexia bacterium]